MYCPSCGDEIDDDARYCRHCGADVDDQGAGIEPVDRAARVEHQCWSCGEMLRSSNPPCKYCGGMDIETRSVTPTDGGRHGTPTPPASGGGGTGRETQFYIGAVVAVAGVIVFPYVFIFVAVPESIWGLFGGSIQNALGRDARDNAFVTGSFLILRWFGNFLILLFLLGVMIGLFAVV